MDKKMFDKLIYTDEKINDELLTAIIKAGSHEYIKSVLTEPTKKELDGVSFSKSLEKIMIKQLGLLKKSKKIKQKIDLLKKTINIITKIAASLFVVFIISGIFIATSEAAQVKVVNTFIEVFDIKTDIKFSDDEQINITSLASIFSYIPEGFEIVNETNYETFKAIEYLDDAGNFLNIVQQDKGSLSLDTENTNSYQLIIGNYTCIISEKDEETIVIFKDDLHVYTLSSNIPMDEIKKIITNIKQ